MKLRLYVILLSVASLLACENEVESAMVGNWVDQKNEFIQLNISQSKGKLWLKFPEKLYEINTSGDIYTVNINNKKLSLYYQKRERLLSFNNIIYIPESESFTNTFLGKWSLLAKEESIVFDISMQNGILIWDIIKNKQKPVRYYPKKTREGFTFTIDNKQLFFSLLGNCIIDSSGRRFCKS